MIVWNRWEVFIDGFAHVFYNWAEKVEKEVLKCFIDHSCEGDSALKYLRDKTNLLSLWLSLWESQFPVQFFEKMVFTFNLLRQAVAEYTIV